MSRFCLSVNARRSITKNDYQLLVYCIWALPGSELTRKAPGPTQVDALLDLLFFCKTECYV